MILRKCHAATVIYCPSQLGRYNSFIRYGISSLKIDNIWYLQHLIANNVLISLLVMVIGQINDMVLDNHWGQRFATSVFTVYCIKRTFDYLC